MKESYIEKIKKQIELCDDIALLDLVSQFLSKSGCTA